MHLLVTNEFGFFALSQSFLEKEGASCRFPRFACGCISTFFRSTQIAKAGKATSFFRSFLFASLFGLDCPLPASVRILENGCIFPVDLLHSSETGTPAPLSLHFSCLLLFSSSFLLFLSFGISLFLWVVSRGGRTGIFLSVFCGLFALNDLPLNAFRQRPSESGSFVGYLTSSSSLPYFSLSISRSRSLDLSLSACIRTYVHVWVCIRVRVRVSRSGL